MAAPKVVDKTVGAVTVALTASILVSSIWSFIGEIGWSLWGVVAVPSALVVAAGGALLLWIELACLTGRTDVSCIDLVRSVLWDRPVWKIPDHSGSRRLRARLVVGAMAALMVGIAVFDPVIDRSISERIFVVAFAGWVLTRIPVEPTEDES